MSITLQVERWADVKPEECEPLFAIHWEEVARDKEKIKLEVDREKYTECERLGKFHLVTLRDDGKLVGYFAGFIDTHPHYKSTLFFSTDVYFILPEYRQTRWPLKMFLFMEDSLRLKGVKKMVTITKVHQDHSRLFEWLGWTLTEKVYTKCL